eukprot:CAMPEP_0197079536 /NCGR_PEP_ID=MMETSP1384-20130603/213673_1 /TAXON_ID=29189 /ORGANISM="Ammonia sp." /LENGTH=552 /DNA_ID=CAMNT_0042518413 /DNA_START=84 /DNA_END=1746 /DNA_ORIENTATION=-
MSLTIQVKTSKKSIRLNKKFDAKSDTIFSVKQAYCDQETGKDPNKLNLIFNAKTLKENNATLYSVGMTRKVAIVTVTTKVIGGAYNNNGGNKTLTVQVKTSKKSIRLNQKFDPKQDTVFSVKQAYCDQETGKDPNKLNLIFNAKTLPNNEATLWSVGMTRKVAIVTVTTKVIGGAAACHFVFSGNDTQSGHRHGDHQGDGGAYNNNGGDKTLAVSVRTSKKAYRLRQKFDPKQDTVFSVKKAYCDQETGKDPTKINLIFGNKTLQNDEATLLSVGMGKGGRKVALVTVTTKVVGGAAALTGSQILKSLLHVEFGGVFCAVLHVDEYEWEIRCPVPKCNAVFDFEIASKVADMTDDEYLFFADEFAKRNAPETKQCPNCGDDCERPADLTQFRVNCVACDGGDWCFLCAGKWQGGGFTVCGNNGCPSGDINKVLSGGSVGVEVDDVFVGEGGGFTVCGNNGCPSAEINEVLKTCPLKATTYTEINGKYVEVPQIRACPKCLEFIEHDDECKHMHCHACGHDFCFSCLQGKKDGNWQCNSVDYQCPIAPRQVLK